MVSVVGDFNGVGDLKEGMQLQRKHGEEEDAIFNLRGSMT